jgi:hypothetical protein
MRGTCDIDGDFIGVVFLLVGFLFGFIVDFGVEFVDFLFVGVFGFFHVNFKNKIVLLKRCKITEID